MIRSADPQTPSESIPQARHQNYRSVLICCGPTGQLDFDPEPVFKKIATGGRYNFVTIHVLSPWNNLCQYPWNEDLKRNEKWFDHFDQILQAAARYSVGLHLVFFDRYGVELAKWKAGPHRDAIPCAKFPLRMSARELFSNWNGKDVNKPRNFARLFWKADGDRLIDAKPSNPRGEAIVDGYLIPVIKSIAETARKYPDTFYFRWTMANEPLAWVRCLDRDCNRVKTDDSRSLLQDPRATDYIRGLFSSNGLDAPKTSAAGEDRFREINGEQFFVSGKGMQTCNACLVNHQQELAKRGILLEVHGSDADSIKDLIDAGLDPAWTIFSQDGVPDRVILEEAKKTRTLDLPNFELKLADQFGPGGKWDPQNLNKNLESAIPTIHNIER